MSFRQALTRVIRTALDEDIGPGDITTGAALRGDERGIAQATAKAEMVVAGIDVFGEVFLSLDASLIFTARRRDGETVGERGSPCRDLRQSRLHFDRRTGGPEPLPADVRNCHDDPALQRCDQRNTRQKSWIREKPRRDCGSSTSRPFVWGEGTTTALPSMTGS